MTEPPTPHADRRPLATTAGPTVDEQHPISPGDAWGAPWGTTWFVLSGEIPDAWAGRRVEAVIDIGFRGDAAGFQAEGLVVDGNGRPIQGVHPRRTNVPVDARPGPVTVRVEAASNPSFPQFRPHRHTHTHTPPTFRPLSESPWSARRPTRPCVAGIP